MLASTKNNLGNSRKIALWLLKQIIQGAGGFIFGVGTLITLVHPFEAILSIDFFNWAVLIASMFVLTPYLKKVIKDRDWQTIKTVLHAATMIFIL